MPAGAHDFFTYRAADTHGGSDLATLSIAVSQTPQILNSSVAAGTATEGGNTPVKGSLLATDNDAASALTWTIANTSGAGSAVHGVNYHVAVDELKITRSATSFFDDTFGDGLAPPNAPNFGNGTTATYDVTGGVTESGGYAMFDSSSAVDTTGLATTQTFRFEQALLLSNRQVGVTNGLRQAVDFSVEGKFQLSLPTDIRESYGIRLTDQHGVNFTGETANQGDDVVELSVRRDLDNVVRVDLFQKNFATNQSVILDSFALTPAAGDDSIVLRLNHVANSTNITAAFDLYNGATLDSANSHSFTFDGQIFGYGLDAGGTNKTVEDWTRADIFTSAPTKSDTFIDGTYGTLTLDQTGEWYYTLDNTRTATNALAAGDVVHDQFTATVTDSDGHQASRLIDVTVNGANDAPLAVLDRAVVSGTLSPAAVYIPNEALLFNDHDPDQGAVLQVVSNTSGSASPNFTYQIADEHNATSNTAGVAVTTSFATLTADPAGSILVAAQGLGETLVGGAGTDVFVIPQTVSNGGNTIQIHAFDHAHDAIDLSYVSPTLGGSVTESNIDDFVRINGVHLEYRASGTGPNWITQADFDVAHTGESIAVIWMDHTAHIIG